MASTKLGKPTGAMVYQFTKAALLAGVDEIIVEETLNRWLEGSLEVPYSREEMAEKIKAAANQTKKDDVLCVACLAACKAWFGLDPVCTGICHITVCA